MTNSSSRHENSKSSNSVSANGANGNLEDEQSAAAEQADSGSDVLGSDTTYRALRDEDRVVMRHQIALNIDEFRASSDDFSPRPTRSFTPLQSVTPPFMTVIVPNYNGRDHLATVLSALRRQTFSDFETIVVDDASSDDSVAFIEAQFPGVRLLVNRHNEGFVKSCNTAAAAADGRILVMLNSDTEPEPTWLAALAQAICANPQAAIVTSKLLLFDDRKRLHAAGDEMGKDGIPRNRGVWQEDRGQFDTDRAVFSGCGGASAYRRDVWEALGGFDEEFWMYLEDTDFGFRAQLLGWQAVFVPDARVYHHLSASGGDTLSSYYVGRNTIWTIAKNMPRRLLFVNLAAIVGAQFSIALDAARHWRGQAARARLRGQIAGLLGLRRQFDKRQVIQARKQIDGEAFDRLLASEASEQ